MQLDPLTVTATRIGTPAFDVPASIDRVTIEHDNLGVNLSESLQGVPGLVARDRQNYAQDTQLSIRGFGARSAFGIRGLRVYVDGLPATQPDGQGQVSQINLATADRVEVLRGPFSTLYGNSSGGVIQVFTRTEQARGLEAAAFEGSHGDERRSLMLHGDGATLGYSGFSTDGYRPHSAAERRSANGKADIALPRGGSLSLVLNHFDAPDAEDPLGLTRSQFDANPDQTAAVATQFDTRKNARQTQGGAVLTQPLTSTGELRAMAYGGQRDILQRLAIPIATQQNPRSAGGVVDLASGYGGGDLRWTETRGPLTLIAGLSYDTLEQQRRGFENFVGTNTTLQGALRRDERNTANAFDQYLQAGWRIAPRWSALAGLRHSRVEFESDDRYIRAGNPDDSGRAAYSATTPAVGLLFAQTPRLHWYGSYGTGFETPTFAELAYRSDGQPGLNFDLDAARSRNAEAGLKAKPFEGTTLTLAAFRIDVRDELVTQTNSGGRASYSNAARTRRQGGELSLDSRLGQRVQLQLAYTLLEARVRRDYRTCTSAPCTTPRVLVARGNHLPGVPDGQLSTRLSWAATPAWRLAAEYRYLDAVPVNDVNSEAAPSYGVLDLETSYELVASANRVLRASLRVENVFDERYAGSVIVNDANGRFYEPARDRSVLAGLSVQLKP